MNLPCQQLRQMGLAAGWTAGATPGEGRRRGGRWRCTPLRGSGGTGGQAPRLCMCVCVCACVCLCVLVCQLPARTHAASLLPVCCAPDRYAHQRTDAHAVAHQELLCKNVANYENRRMPSQLRPAVLRAVCKQSHSPTLCGESPAEASVRPRQPTLRGTTPASEIVAAHTILRLVFFQGTLSGCPQPASLWTVFHFLTPFFLTTQLHPCLADPWSVCLT
eukprot:scaffold265278_cov21-Tisochrysis_lutea.AAC.1